MKILIGQPIFEEKINQLEKEVIEHDNVDLFLYPEGYLHDNLEIARLLADTYNKIITTGYKKPKDKAVIIARDGTLLLDRMKYDDPNVVDVEYLKVGFLLCDELVLHGLNTNIQNIDMVLHPIGVGMFSEEQFDEWINLAKETAIKHKTIILGTSHADGSFQNCGLSIPIAYCINQNGEEIFIMKNDTRSVLLDLNTLECEIKEKFYM
jgi:hypothetical protein